MCEDHATESKNRRARAQYQVIVRGIEKPRVYRSDDDWFRLPEFDPAQRESAWAASAEACLS
ncbi:MAG: hypothetical protein HY788_06720 [Deltaproteobacteria bacterium]|nr:hypothetical protein [Deltaproteobacteria bacterium]